MKRLKRERKKKAPELKYDQNLGLKIGGNAAVFLGFSVALRVAIRSMTEKGRQVENRRMATYDTVAITHSLAGAFFHQREDAQPWLQSMSRRY